MSAKSKGQSNSRNAAEQADEMKRRARRRLLGAMALFLTALIVVPSVIDTEPEQTSSPIELVVPSRSDLDTVSPILSTPPGSLDDSAVTPDGSPDTATQSDVAPGEPADISAGAREVVQVKPKSASGAPAKSTSATQSEAKPSAATAVKPVSQPAQKPSQTAQPAPPKSAPVAEPASTADPIARFAQADVFWVQVVAVKDRGRAEALRDKLSAAGFEGRIESVSTDAGLVYRVRVGPLAGQARASETKAQLKQAGYEGRIVQ